MKAIRSREISASAPWLTILTAALLGSPCSVRGDFFNPTLYFSRYTAHTENKVTLSYDSTAHTFGLGPISTIATTPGADGLVFTSDNFLAVGGQGNAVYRVNPITGAFTTQNAGGTSAFEMMVAPNGTIYSAGREGGYGTPTSYNSTLTSNGTPHAVSGSEAAVGITHIAWSGSDSNHGFYTSANGGAGSGSFGTIDLTNPGSFVTQRLIASTAAAHSLVYDPFTGKLVLFGADHISLIDPKNPSVLFSDRQFPNEGFDQGAVDGLGHIYAASNGGDLVFVDIQSTGKLETADFVRTTFLAGDLDDVAPLVGPGSPVPEPGSLLLSILSVIALVGYRFRRGACVTVSC